MNTTATEKHESHSNTSCDDDYKYDCWQQIQKENPSTHDKHWYPSVRVMGDLAKSVMIATTVVAVAISSGEWAFLFY